MPILFDKLFYNKSGIVNVRMVITEEKILSNIDKVQKMINPKSKKQIVQLEEDSYFKDLVDSIKTYLEEYPKKKNFPRTVYRAAYDLVEFATNQFEENTKKIEELIIQREKNIGLAFELKMLLSKVLKKEEGYEQEIENSTEKYSEDITEALKLLSTGTDEEKISAKKLVEARINNLESNFHIEIDMERIEDRSKALSFIGIEIAEALKYIPTPVEEIATTTITEEVTPAQVTKEEKAYAKQLAKQEKVRAKTMGITQEENVNSILAQVPTNENDEVLSDTYMQQTRFDVKPSLWQKIKNSRLVRTISYIMKIRVVLELPALPEGRGDNNY